MSVESGLIKVFRRGAKAPAKAPPFYSAVDNAVDNLPGRATPEQMVKELLKQKEVKAQELIDRGIDKKLGVPIVQKERTVKLKKPDSKGNTEKQEKYFEVTPSEKGAKAITKDDVINAVEQNPPKQITEDIMGDPTPAMINQKIDDLIHKDIMDELGSRSRYGYESEDAFDSYYDSLWYQKSKYRDSYYQAAKEAIKEEGNWGASKYDRSDWKLPGGENYREILLKLPATKSANTERIMELEAKQRRGGTNQAMDEELARLKAEAASGQEEYKSRHWEQPNVLAHMRVQDRVGPNGEKVLHVEEIQSDWHQEGRDRGYGADWKVSQDENGKFVVLRNGRQVGGDGFDNERMAQRALEIGQQNDKVVPDAPFKKNWHELAMKRLINYASENGYDKIAITPGAEQASRYNLANIIDEINVVGRTHAGTGEKTKQVALDTVDGRSLRLGVNNDGVVDNVSDSSIQNFIGKDLSEIVGKDIAKNIMSGGTQTISGEGLQVGGEGMKGFYDQMLTAYLNKYGEKHGSRVGQMPIAGKEKMVPDNAGLGMIRSGEPELINLHTFDITPSMREEVLTKGQPLYQQIGIPAATGAAGAEMPEEPGFAEGGAVNENTVPDMSDGGKILQGPPFKRGGKVSITNNPDAMFLELNDKKFRRK